MRHPSGRDSATSSVHSFSRRATRCAVLLLLMLAAGAVFVAPALAAGSISGFIYDEDAEPIAGVSVHTLRSVDGGATYAPSAMAVSDTAGAYTVPTPGAGLYKMWFDDPLGNYVSEWWRNWSGGDDGAEPFPLDEDTAAVGFKTVLATAGHAGGHVAAWGGGPLENIRVDVHRWVGGPQGWEGYAMGMSAADGTWSVGGLAPGQYRFHFRDEMGGVYADQFFDRQSTSDSAQSVYISAGMNADWINAELHVGAFISGVVQDEGGAPVGGVEVIAFMNDPAAGGWPGVRSATTTPLGQYALGPLAPGQYRLWFRGDATWVSEWWEDKANEWEADFVPVNVGGNVVCNATLIRAGAVGGSVAADTDGQPLEGIEVTLERWMGWDFGGWQGIGPPAVTDGDGAYAVEGLRPGEYRVGFRDPDGEWATEWFEDAVQDRAMAIDVPGGQTTPVNASLAPAGHIAGTVRDIGGNPLPGIEVSACRFMGEELEEQWLWGWGTSANENGYFSLDGLAVGTYQIELSDPNGVYAVEVYADALNSGQGIDLEVTAGGTAWVDPVLERGGRVYGQVVGADGRGLPDVMVSFNCWVDDPEPDPDPDPGTDEGHWEWYTECFTDQQGDFSMSGLQARPTVVEFGDNAGQYLNELYDDVRDWGAATPVDVLADASRNLGTIALTLGGHVAGTVTAADGGSGLENIEVNVARWNSEWGEWEQFTGQQTGPGGSYDVGGLAAGLYRVRFWDGSGAYVGEWFENAADAWSGQDVTVTTGGTTQVDAALEEACAVEGHVTDGSANPLSGIEAILYYRGAGGEWAQYQLDNEERMFTDVDGYYRFAGLPARTYQLRLENNDNPSPWAAEVFDGALVVGTGTDLTLAPGETRVVDPELGLGGSLAGRLLEDQEPYIPLSFAFPMEIGVWAWVPDGGPGGGTWQRYAGYATGDGTDGYMHGSPLAPGEYRIDINCWVGAYVPEWYDDAPDLEHSTPVTITAGEVTDLGTIYMTKSAMIFGTVTGPDGLPLAGVTVRKWTLVDGQWEPGYSFQSWSDGFYLLGEMAGGTYRVEFDGRGIGLSREFWDGASSVLGATDIVLAPRQEVSGIDAQLEVAGAIAGHVRDAGGDPITGVDVMLAVWDDVVGRYVDLDDMQSAAHVDDQGAWRLDGVRPGTYKVFSSPGAPDHGDGVVEGVVVRAGETTEVDIVPPLAGSIAGRVTVIGGAPVQDARVRLFIWDPYELEWQGLAMPAQTQADGTYSLPLVTPGTYRLAFEPSDGSGLAQEFWDNRDMVSVCQDVTLTEDQDLTGVDAVLGPEADVAPPSAPIVTGADGDWHASSVRLDFAATDDLSGVAEYEYRFAAWTTWEHGDHVIVGAPPDHENDGVWDLEVRAVDEVGNVSDSATAQVKIDTTGPVVTDDDPGDWLLRWVQVDLTAVDAGCGVVDHIEYAPTSDGPWQVGTSFVVTTWKRGGGSGERTTWVRAIDGLGNASEPAAVVVRLDGRPPVTTSDSDGLPHAEDVTVHLTVDDAHSGPGVTFFSVDGGMWMAGDTLFIPALPGGWNDGTHDVRFYSVDAVGNVEQSIKSCTVTIDTLGLL